MLPPRLIHTVLPALPVALPLIGAATSEALRKELTRRTLDVIAIFITAITLGVCMVLLHASLAQTIVVWFGNWYPRGSVALGICFVIDPVAAGLATLSTTLFLFAFFFSCKQSDTGNNHFYGLMLVFLAAMNGFVLTGDLFNLFVFFELMSTAAFALCGLEISEPAPLQGSFNFAVTNTVAAFLELTGIAILYSITGALNMAQIGLALNGRHDRLVLFAFALLICGFLVKAAIVPFHFWLPDAHTVAPTSVCVIFSGLMFELGIYAVARTSSVIFSPSLAWHPFAARNLLFAFAAVTVVLGGLMCYAEHHIKRMLAFSTICHSGLMLATFAIGGPHAIAAMFTYLGAHAFAKATLFFVTGILFHRLRSHSEKDLFGTGRKLRFTAALWFLGGLALAAVPSSGLFAGETAADSAASALGAHGIALLFFFGGILTAAAVFRVGIHTFTNWGTTPLTDKSAVTPELPETVDSSRIFPVQFVPAALCLLGCFAFPWLPHLRPTIVEAASRFAFQPGYLHTVYTGSSIPGATFSLFSSHELHTAAARSTLAIVCALAIALSSVFRRDLAPVLRLGSKLEHGVPALRELQSGHPGDYVTWLTVGIALFAAIAAIFLH